MAKLNFHQSSVSHDPSNHSNGPFLQTVMMSFHSYQHCKSSQGYPILFWKNV